MRIDLLLVHRGIASTRAQAQRMVASGVQWRQGDMWRRAGKNGDEVSEDADIQLLNAAQDRYVSRGGLKLEGALATTGIQVSGLTCLDVGQSTGGFTDCLLQHGAHRVLGVDVGQGQLHASLQADRRVLGLEQVNARAMDAQGLVQRIQGRLEEPGEFVSAVQAGFDLIVGDLSFISLTLVLPALVSLLKANGRLLMLVKPQFELQPGQVGKGGIVRDASLFAVVQQRVHDCLGSLHFGVRQWLESPIQGGDGNREFFVLATRNN